jgi:hypothetical protein
MTPWRHAPAGVAAVLAAATLGLLVHVEHAQGAEIRALETQVKALRADVADRSAEPPPPVARCAFDSDLVQSIATAVSRAVARPGASATGPTEPGAPGAAPPGVEPPRSNEQELALAGASEGLGEILKRGKATPADLARIGQQISLAGSSAETDAMRAQLSKAINDGKLTIDRHPAP